MKKLILLILLVVISVSLKAQEKKFVIPDSLKGKSYEELKMGFKDHIQNNKAVAEVYARVCLWKGKRERDSNLLAKGYRMLSIIYKDEIQMLYLDSIIVVTKDTYTKDYPAFAYLIKGVNYYSKHLYIPAMENYAKAIKFCEKSGNKEMLYDVKYNVGILKIKTDEVKQSLSIFKECYSFALKNNYVKTNNTDYLSTLFALSDSYERNHIPDSSSFYNKLGYREATLSKNLMMRKFFVLNEGANHSHKGNHQVAIDSIESVLKSFEEGDDYSNTGIAYFYLGKSYYKTNKKILGIKYLKRMDSIIQEHLYLMPEEREGYEILINHFKLLNNSKEQLFFLKKLIKVDSVLHDNYKDISKVVSNKYDKPILISEKEKLITSLQKGTKILNNKFYIIFFLFVLSLGLSGFYYSKQRIYKKKFKQLINKKTKKDASSTSKPVSIPNISKEKVNEILIQLNQFEKRKVFLQNNISLSYTSQIFNTNTSYLSKIINHYKKQSFTTYLNDLRINYAIETLKENKKLRSYTIKAIANELGFNNAESFSKAFYKKTGIYPSYFIKKIKKEKF